MQRTDRPKAGIHNCPVGIRSPEETGVVQAGPMSCLMRACSLFKDTQTRQQCPCAYDKERKRRTADASRGYSSAATPHAGETTRSHQPIALQLQLQPQ